MLVRYVLPWFLFAALGAQSPATKPSPEAKPSSAALPEGAPQAMAAIQGKDLIAHATFLASDELEGRLTGSPGHERAIDYIAKQFQQLGLEPLGDDVDGKRGFVQRYGIARTFVRQGSGIAVDQETWLDGFAVLGAKPRQIGVRGTLRYVGRGRTRGAEAEVPEDMKLDGVVPVVVVRPPRGTPGKALSMEQKFALSFQTLSGLGQSAQALGKRGAKVVLFTLVDDPTGFVDVLNYVGMSPGKDLVSPRFTGAEDATGMLAGLLGRAGDTAVVVLTPARSAQLYRAFGVDRTALARYLSGEGDAPKAARELPGSVDLTIEQDPKATAANVVAVLRGRDAVLRDEAVVFSAHNDHVGRRMDGEVYNGADDNASGSSGLLGIAKAFAQAGERPRRSVIFLSVSGEELGLWGSAFYADHPTWPADRIVADVNTDMIGRSGPESGPDEVTVTPSHDHRMFSTIVQDAARFASAMGLGLQSGDKYYERSDHFNFAKKGIPVVFFCTGEHADYHQVTDSADKLEPAKMERLARLAFWTGWAVANADERPRKLGPRPDWK